MGEGRDRGGDAPRERLEAGRGRPDQVPAALENLITNAVQHGAGDVTVSAGTMESGLYVEDGGPRIPGADRDRVFESGFSTSVDEISVGLSVVKQIVLGHGWDVEVTDK